MAKTQIIGIPDDELSSDSKSAAVIGALTGADLVNYYAVQLPTNSGIGSIVSRLASTAALTPVLGAIIDKGKNDGGVINGDDGPNTLNGGGGNDTINGKGGNDTINGGGGNDTLNGNDGNDAINGGGGNDIIDGGKGNDVVHGDGGNDTIAGGDGNDTINGDGGDDVIVGGNGNDTIKGDGGDDVMEGGAGNDAIDGAGGTDTARFSGTFANYRVTGSGENAVITDLRGGSPDGTDTLHNVSLLKFSDRTISVKDAIAGSPPPTNSPPTAVTLTNPVTALNEGTDTSAGLKVANIVVTDDGLGTNNLGLTGADAASFQIVGTELRLKAGTLDYETKSLYSVRVVVDDPGVGANPDATSGLFTVSVTDVNEKPNAGNDFSVSVPENVGDATVIATVTATDPDAGGSNDASNNFEDLTYAIANDSSGKFEINAAGQLSLKAGQSLDFETAQTHAVTVSVTDGGGLSDQVLVTVNVTDVNEPPANNPPTAVGFANTTTVINENTDTSAGVKVADIAVTDDGIGTNNLALAGPDAASFEIVGTGLFLKAGTLNYEAKSSYSVQVTVNDPAVGGNPDATSATFKVDVTDVNEAPKAPAPFSVNAAENISDTTVIATVTGTDPDAGGGNDASNNFEDLTYSIANDSSGKFEINGTTGQLSLLTGQTLNFAAAQSHVVTVRVTDGPGLFDDVAVTINVTQVTANNPPTAVGFANTTTLINENTDTSAGVKVADIVVTDDAVGTNTLGLTGADAALFAIDGTQLLLKAGTLNFEAKSSYSVQVTADDQTVGASPDATSAVFTVNVNDLTEQPNTVADINLATLSASQGFAIFGAAALSASGRAVASAGDINGDGFGDVIIGAAYTGTGTAYVVYGRAGGFANIDLADFAASTSQGFRIIGVDPGDLAGYSVSSAGDVNGDGFDDLIVGARDAGAEGNQKALAGESYLIFGKAGGLADINLSSFTFANQSQGFRILGADGLQPADPSPFPGDRTGVSVSAGDINGDGFADLVVGAQLADGKDNLRLDSGEVYVIFGRSAVGQVDVGNLLPIEGFTIFGAHAGDQLGFSVAAAGDVNGDGYDDLILGALTAVGSGTQGEAYLIFGKSTGFGDIDLLGLAPSTGIRIFGSDAGGGDDRLGYRVSSAGDVNGDGYADVIVGARQADGLSNQRPSAGEAYVIFGHAGAFTDIDISAAGFSGTQGFRIYGTDGGTSTIGVGTDAGDNLGAAVASAGDFNGDGFDDLIVGARYGETTGEVATTNRGEAYVLFGHAGGFTDIDTATLSTQQGFRIIGANVQDLAGRAVASAGDVNGDGFDDLIVGAPYADPGGKNEAGESYIIFGSNVTGSVVHLGTDTNDTLPGTAASETFVGGQGSDVMIGGGGADTFHGGAGDDDIRIADTSFALVDGGSGTDVLRLAGSGLALDLTVLSNSKVTDVERIDLTGSGNNSLTLNVSDVLDISSSTNSLFVTGDAGDAVTAVGAWSDAGTVVNGGTTYVDYANGLAHLLVQQGVTTTVI